MNERFLQKKIINERMNKQLNEKVARPERHKVIGKERHWNQPFHAVLTFA